MLCFNSFVCAAAMQQTFTREQCEEIYHSLMPRVLNPSGPLLNTQLWDASADLWTVCRNYETTSNYCNASLITHCLWKGSILYIWWRHHPLIHIEYTYWHYLRCYPYILSTYWQYILCYPDILSVLIDNLRCYPYILCTLIDNIWGHFLTRVIASVWKTVLFCCLL